MVFVQDIFCVCSFVCMMESNCLVILCCVSASSVLTWNLAEMTLLVVMGVYYITLAIKPNLLRDNVSCLYNLYFPCHLFTAGKQKLN